MAAILGISFPFRKGSTSFPETSQDERTVEDSIISILMTPVGQRVMRPRFGCNARKYIFENNNELLQAKIRHETLRALQVNEPRIRVSSVGVSSSETRVSVTVNYFVNRNPASTTVDFQKTGA